MRSSSFGMGVLLVVSALACRGTPRATPPGAASPAELGAIRATLDELYRAFCFDAGAEPDWKTQRRIYLEGAVFVPPIRADRAPRADDTQTFLADFEAFATSAEYQATGFHERILSTRIDVFGGVAHAFVAFEGFLPPGGEARSRGLDSIQLVHDGEAWRLVSFTTQYEGEDLVLPERFVLGR